jgi:hypothetical protein
MSVLQRVLSSFQSQVLSSSWLSALDAIQANRYVGEGAIALLR